MASKHSASAPEAPNSKKIKISSMQKLDQHDGHHWEEHKTGHLKGVKKIWYAPNQFEAYGDEEIEAVTKCLKAGWLAPGPITNEFEQKVAAVFGKTYGTMVNSGSSGNLLALLIAGVGPGDEVVTSALTFSTVVAPIEQLGATPVFVDSDPLRYVPTAEAILKAVTPKTKCIMIPNLIGSKPDWEAIRAGAPKMTLIEDSCDTLTHTPCTDIAVTSFYASHIITAGGGGGMVMYNTKEERNKVLMYRDWGRIGTNSEDMSERFNYKVDEIPYDFKFLYGALGYNFKSTEMNAAFGLCQINKLDHVKKTRQANIARYCERLKGTSYELPKKYNDYDWLAMPFMHPKRKEVLNFLEQNDVQTRVCFAGNVTRHPAFRKYLKEYPEADRVMAQGFLLGAHHGLTTKDVDRVCDLLIEFDNKNKA